jgi:5-(carboxyamino)imidazole ribonucleotide mutase
MKDVLIIMGSDSDKPILEEAKTYLEQFGLTYDQIVASAHRNPERVTEIAKNASKNYRVVIAAAGKAAHLPGVFAGHTTLPVIGVPIKTSDLGGLDSLYSIVQMPKGVPVATVAINGAANAAILAVQIIATGIPELKQKLESFKEELKG